MHIWTIFVVFSLLIIGSNGWFWRGRKRRRRPTASPNFQRPPLFSSTAQISSITTTTTTSPKSQKCIKFSKAISDVPQISKCAPYLRHSCVSQDNLVIFNDVTLNKMAKLEDILMRIKSRNCDCSKRSIELFCRFLLPECSIPSLPIDSCDIPTCSQPVLKLPCSDYCNNLTARCFAESESNPLNKIFEPLNQTVSDICNGLDVQSCWRNKNANFTECVVNKRKFAETIENTSAVASPCDKSDYKLVIAFGVPALVLLIIIFGTVWHRCRKKKKIERKIVVHNIYSESVCVTRRVESCDTLTSLSNEFQISADKPISFEPKKHYENVQVANVYMDMTGRSASRGVQNPVDLDYVEIRDEQNAESEPYVNFYSLPVNVKESN